MILKEKIGQLFMMGFHGVTPSKAVRRLIRDFHIGGVILFSRNLKNPGQTAALCNALQGLPAKMPLLIAIDQEGGRVSRLPKGFTIFPSAAQLAAGGLKDRFYRVADITARELRAVGINMNMAPVLDVNTNPANPIIGDRSFGSTPSLVGRVGLETIAGYQDNSIIACGKHFPGHGDTHLDSHRELPTVSHDIRRLGEVELRPFLHAIGNGLAAIMTAHVLYPALDPDFPATLSRKIITGLLRERIGFQGVVVTDDLEMKAIADAYGPGEAAVRSIEAGCDILLICQDEAGQLSALEAVARAVKSKRITEKRIDQSVLRILKIKEKFILPYQPADRAAIKTTVGNPAHRRLVEDLQVPSAPPRTARPRTASR
ncbi:MAG TPA: beta-N-acetylhexosaminidase [Nitrospiria bacterium]